MTLQQLQSAYQVEFNITPVVVEVVKDGFVILELNVEEMYIGNISNQLALLALND